MTVVADDRRLASDGHHVDGFITLPAEVLFDRTLSEEGVALYAVLVSTGLRLGLGVVLEDLGAKVPVTTDSVLMALQALRDRGLISWEERERYYVEVQPLVAVYGPLSGRTAQAHHAVVCDPEIPIKAKLLLWTISLDPFASDDVLAGWLGWTVEEIEHWLDALTLAGYISRAREHQVRRVWRGWFRERRVEHRDVERWALTPMDRLYYWPPAPTWSPSVRPRVLTTADFRAMDYHSEYLRSGHWRSIREQALRRDGHRCTRCGSRRNLHVHHDDYSYIGLEHLHMESIRTLCASCHRRQHGQTA